MRGWCWKTGVRQANAEFRNALRPNSFCAVLASGLPHTTFSDIVSLMMADDTASSKPAVTTHVPACYGEYDLVELGHCTRYSQIKTYDDRGSASSPRSQQCELAG